jgi:coniferyl-aldehyde dehydrogenase
VVGVIVPWNFPVVLSVAPIITALAAGNRVMVKLSEYTPRTNQVIEDIFSHLSDHIVTVQGEGEIARYFSALPFDHLLFTGSTQVGKLVAAAAAQNLTPVTLELGGKSPVILAEDAEINSAVDAILLGKSINAGQICVAPDYLLLPEHKEQAFIERYLAKFNKLYVKKGRMHSATHIINNTQYQRLQALLNDAQTLGAKIHKIEKVESEGRQMPPYLLTQVTDNMRVMKEEIFGPILPIITYRSFDEVFDIVNSRPRPLALYLMTNDKKKQQSIVRNTHSGSVVFNDTLVHVAVDDAPFGGIGESGMGHYHGEEGFLTFSKAKTVMLTPRWLPRSAWLLRFRKTAVYVLGKLYIR